MNNSNVIEVLLRKTNTFDVLVESITEATRGTVFATDIYLQNGYIIVIGAILGITFEYTYCILPELEGKTTCIQLSIDKRYCNLLIKAARAVLTSYMEDETQYLIEDFN